MQRSVLWLIASVVGGALVLLGSAGGLLALAWILASGGTPTAAETLPVAGMVALGLGLGAPLALHGWAAWQARPTRPFAPSGVWWMWLAWVLLVGLGTVISSRSLAPALWLPPIHVLTMALPPLIMLCLAGRSLHGTGGSWREVVVGMAGGGTLGLVGSLLGEMLIALALIAAATVVLLMMPGGAERIAALVEDLQDPAWVTDLNNLSQFLLSPVVAISTLALFTIPVPLVEETFKTLAAGIVARWVRPYPARAFLWGVAGGAGFALAENLLNGALGSAESWALGAVARFGATLMHCFTSGLVGWGWGQLWTARRPLRLLGAFAAAVAVHGLWNGAALGVVFVGASGLAHGGDGLWPTLTGSVTILLLGLLVSLAVTFILALPAAGRRLAAGTERLQQKTARPEEIPGPVSSRASAS